MSITSYSGYADSQHHVPAKPFLERLSLDA